MLPITFALARFKPLVGTRLAIKTELLDDFTTTAVALFVEVLLLKILIVSVFAVFVLNPKLLDTRVILFALATYCSTEVPSKYGYKTVSGLKSVAVNKTDLALM